VVNWIGLLDKGVAQVSGHSIRVGATQDLLALNTDLASVMQAGRWKTNRMPIRYGEHVLAAWVGMARAAEVRSRDKSWGGHGRKWCPVLSEQTYTRVSLAVEQLDLALMLFLDMRSYVSALTLAGAAEEILGRALVIAGKGNTLRQKYESMATFHEALHRAPLKWADFVDGENRARNAVKHLRLAIDETLTVDLEHTALWMIVRACDNFERIGMARTERMFQFDEWFHVNVAGI